MSAGETVGAFIDAHPFVCIWIVVMFVSAMSGGRS